MSHKQAAAQTTPKNADSIQIEAKDKHGALGDRETPVSVNKKGWLSHYALWEWEWWGHIAAICCWLNVLE